MYIILSKSFYFLFNFYIYSLCILHFSTCSYKDSFKELIYTLWSRLLCRLDMMFWFPLSSCGVYLCVHDSDGQNIFNQRQQIKSMVVRMLQNWNHRYSSHNSNIKCVDLTIK